MDALERLATVTVPPVPAAPVFAAGVRRKLHPRLLALHLVEFAIGATVWAVMHMAGALVAAGCYTFTGRWPRGAERRREDT